MTLTAPGRRGRLYRTGGWLSGEFLYSRKWTFERDKLIVRDHKGEPLAEMSFAAGRFQGNGAGGGSVALARP